MRVAALTSGGKDSILALHVAHQWGWDVTHLVMAEPQNEASWMWHTPNLHVVPLIAESMGLPLVRVPAEGGPDEELEGLEAGLAELDIDGFVSGAVASEYQRTRLERVGHKLGLKSFTPLWHKDPMRIIETLMRGAFWVRVVAVAANGMREEWLGRRMTPRTVEHLEMLHQGFGVHLGGEGGEYETLVVDAPLYRQAIQVVRSTSLWNRDHGIWFIEEARLGPEREGRGFGVGPDLVV